MAERLQAVASSALPVLQGLTKYASTQRQLGPIQRPGADAGWCRAAAALRQGGAAGLLQGAHGHMGTVTSCASSTAAYCSTHTRPALNCRTTSKSHATPPAHRHAPPQAPCPSLGALRAWQAQCARRERGPRSHGLSAPFIPFKHAATASHRHAAAPVPPPASCWLAMQSLAQRGPRLLLPAASIKRQGTCIRAMSSAGTSGRTVVSRAEHAEQSSPHALAAPHVTVCVAHCAIWMMCSCMDCRP